MSTQTDHAQHQRPGWFRKKNGKGGDDCLYRRARIVFYEFERGFEEILASQVVEVQSCMCLEEGERCIERSESSLKSMRTTFAMA